MVVYLQERRSGTRCYNCQIRFPNSKLVLHLSGKKFCQSCYPYMDYVTLAGMFSFDTDQTRATCK